MIYGKLTKTFLFTLLLVCIMAFSFVGVADAVATTNGGGATQPADETAHRCQGGTSFLGFPTWYQYLPVDDDCNVSAIRIDGPDSQVNFGSTIGAVLLAVTEILLRVAGIIAVGFVIYGGFIMMISQGAPEKWKSGLKTLLNGMIGLVIAVFAVTAINVLSNILTG